MRALPLALIFVVPFCVGQNTALRVSPTALQFTGVANGGAFPSQSIFIVNDTQITITGDWTGTATSSTGLGTNSVQATFTQSGNTFTGNVITPFGAGMASGTISGTTIQFGSGGAQGHLLAFAGTFGPTTMTGTYTVTDQGFLDDAGTFSLTRQGATPPGGTITFTAQASTLNGQNWLNVQPNSGTSIFGSGLNSTLTVSGQTSNLAAGRYTGQITITSPGAPNSPVVVTVLLNVLAAGTIPPPQVQPIGSLLIASAGHPAQQAVTISTASTSPVGVTIAATPIDGAGWLRVDRTTANVSNAFPGTLTITAVFDAGFTLGVYRGQVKLTFSDGSPPQTVNLTVVVISPSEATPASFPHRAAAPCNPSKLVEAVRTVGNSFSSLASWPVTVEAIVVDDCGNFANTALVAATFSNGDSPLSLNFIGNGVYQATWQPVNVSAAVTVTVQATAAPLTAAQVALTGQVTANPAAVFIAPGGVVLSASYVKQTMPLGGIIAIYGQNLAATGAAPSTPLPTILGGTTFTAGGRNLPLFYSSSGQVNAQLPFEFTAGSSVALVAKTTSDLTVPVIVQVGAAVPGIFTANASGSGQGIILDTQYRLVDSTQPATAGDTVVVWCTGLGATNPAVKSGDATPLSPLSNVTINPTVTIGGKPATVAAAVLTPTLVGLYQVAVVVPSGVTGSAVQVVMTQGTVSSNTVTMAVR